jgi:hypothetical protein
MAAGAGTVGGATTQGRSVRAMQMLSLFISEIDPSRRREEGGPASIRVPALRAARA